MTSGASDPRRAELRRRQAAVENAVAAAVREGRPLSVVKAPPGSGKTSLLISSAVAAHSARRRVAISAQTNAQADDICRRMTRDHGSVPLCRFASGDSPAPSLAASVRIARSSADLPTDRTVVVGTTAKWGLSSIPQPYDVLLVDEAWQMAWCEFMPLGAVAAEFVLIGDPGQIPPVVTVETGRFETSVRPPHFPAPEVILSDPELRERAQVLELPATRRLPNESLSYVQNFYDFHFDAWSPPGERGLEVDLTAQTPVARAMRGLSSATVAAITIPTDNAGPPLERDDALARLVASAVSQALDGGAWVRRDGTVHPLRPEDIGITATHRVMNTALHLALPAALRGRVVVDTPERWQGLERDLMIAIHPLSGTVKPSEFDLETGRLCVMISRHRAGLLLVTRDHIGETLARTVPSASQPVGRPDVAGRGHHIHLGLWQRLAAADLVFAER